MALSLCLGLGLSSPSMGVPAYTTGLTKANTSAFRSVVTAGERNARIIAIGDSTVAGQSTDGGATQAANSWPMKLGLLVSQGGSNNAWGDKACWSLTQTMANYITGDARVAYTGAWGISSVPSAGGNAFQCAAAGSMTLTFPGEVDTAEIIWRDASAGRVFSWSVDGGAATNISSTGTAQIARTTIDLGSNDIHDLLLTWVSGSVIIMGVTAYDSSRNERSVWNWGVCGATSANLLNDADSTAGRLKMIASTNSSPDLALVEGGVINDWRQSVSVATSKANLGTLIDACLAKGSVILVTPVFDGGSTGLTAQQQNYVAAMYELSSEKGVGIFDIRRRWGSYAEAMSAGFMSDNVHPSAAGYADIAAAMKPVIDYALAA